MSQAAFEQQVARLELYAALDQAEAESRDRADAVGHAEMMRRLRAVRA